jgi:hypothetical protein
MRGELQAHWDYFIALDEDLWTLRRYVAFHEGNLDTFSLECHRIIQMAALEVEAAFLCLCRFLGREPCEDERGRTLSFPRLVSVVERDLRERFRYELAQTQILFRLIEAPLEPFRKVKPGDAGKTEVSEGSPRAKEQAGDSRGACGIPEGKREEHEAYPWWHAYTKLKHGRGEHFQKGTLRNALLAVGALGAAVSLLGAYTGAPHDFWPSPKMVRAVGTTDSSVGSFLAWARQEAVFAPLGIVWRTEPPPGTHTPMG